MKFLFNDGDQHVGGDGTPDLRLHGVLGGTQEFLDSQMLLDPFEQLGDILPVGRRIQKSSSSIAFIRIKVKPYRLSGNTVCTRNHVTSCGYQTESPAPFPLG